jgi:hypothetical protein
MPRGCCFADQSAPAAIEESLTEKANDPTATLTQLQAKDAYTIRIRK